MSDALLTRIAEGIDGLRADLKKTGGASAGATPPKTGTAAPGAAAGTNAASTAAAKKAAEDAAKKAAANKGPAAGTKAPGGKHTIEQVREMIRKVAATASLGKESARDVLKDDGGGVEKVIDLKPDKYDAVYEACEVLLKGEGGKPDADNDDLM